MLGKISRVLINHINIFRDKIKFNIFLVWNCYTYAEKILKLVTFYDLVIKLHPLYLKD